MKVSTVRQMRILDRTAMDAFGIADELLMENAGIAVYTVLQNHMAVRDNAFLVFCGVGNNGGDGFVIARHIHAAGGKATVFILGDPKKYNGAAKRNLEIVERLPIEALRLQSTEGVASALAHCHGVVDAIFGTGLIRSVGGLYAEIIDLINRSTTPVISVDIPSGIHGDTGLVMGIAVRADHTVTLGLPKSGNLLYPGYDHCGHLHVSHISFPPTLYEGEEINTAINTPEPLPPRNQNGHKGDFGDTLFIAGASGYFGAPYLAAMSFLKAGGGYSRLAAPASVIPVIAAAGSEIVFYPMDETVRGAMSRTNESPLLDLCQKVDMVVLGPGLSLDDQTQHLARNLAAAIDRPLVIDGDGITALCGHTDIIRKRHAATVLTPHTGEMSRITGIPVEEIETRRMDLVRETAASLNAVIVLKGARTLVGMPDQRVFVNLTGNSGMATAGSGDVLTGTIAAMSGLGLPVEAAVGSGVFIHGLAGNMAAEDKGEDGITARDIMEFLPRAVKYLRESYPEVMKGHGGISVV